MTRRNTIFAVRYGIPAALFIAGWVILFTVDSSSRYDGWAMCVGAAGAVLLLNVLFRLGAQGDRERQQEDAAREYFARHGHWPDERPRAR